MSLNVKFCPEESGIDSFIQSIKSFGNIYYHNFKLKNNSNDYKITGVKNNIIINNKNEQWVMVQCENELEKEKEYIWKIKILKTKYNRIMVGVSPILGKYELNQINILDKFKPITKLDEEKHDINAPNIERGINIHGPQIGGGLDIHGPQIGLDIHGPKIGGGLDMHGPQIGLDIHGPQIGGGLDIHGPIIGRGLNIHGPQIGVGLDIHGPALPKIDISIKNYGWYYYCFNSTLYADFPYNFRNKSTDLKKIKDEIRIIMNMKKKTLKFIIDNEDQKESYFDVPIDNPLTPTILLYDLNDSVQIIEE